MKPVRVSDRDVGMVLCWCRFRRRVWIALWWWRIEISLRPLARAIAHVRAWWHNTTNVGHCALIPDDDDVAACMDCGWGHA